MHIYFNCKIFFTIETRVLYGIINLACGLLVFAR